jgi:serine phosphatase RsbU (regulator of sigma subunit)
MAGPLVEQAATANQALVERASSEAEQGFATGLLDRLDLRTGTLAMVNAGHVPPYLARAGSVQFLELPAGLPLGMFPDVDYQTTDLVLQPGDRLVIVTDDMLERNAAALDLPAQITATRSLHPREATRALADAVLSVSGPALADDATLLVLDWYGDHGRDRATVSGLDAARASSAHARD